MFTRDRCARQRQRRHYQAVVDVAADDNVERKSRRWNAFVLQCSITNKAREAFMRQPQQTGNKTGLIVSSKKMLHELQRAIATLFCAVSEQHHRHKSTKTIIEQ